MRVRWFSHLDPSTQPENGCGIDFIGIMVVSDVGVFSEFIYSDYSFLGMNPVRMYVESG